MYQTTCDKCGNQCEVPFVPTSGKPIYCKDCFKKNSSNDSRRGSSDRRDTNTHTTTCDNCGKQCQVPFKPTSGKPVYCNDCFQSNKTPKENQQNLALEKKLDQLEKKMDHIINLLTTKD